MCYKAILIFGGLSYGTSSILPPYPVNATCPPLFSSIGCILSIDFKDCTVHDDDRENRLASSPCVALNASQPNCGAGIRQLVMGVNPPLFTILPCPPYQAITQYCLVNDVECPVDCIMSDWTAWGPCDVPCGTGIQNRSRVKVQDPYFGGAACPHNLFETQQCAMPDCRTLSQSPTCVPNEWSQWSSCADPCDDSYKIRRRNATVDGNCTTVADTAYCMIKPCGTFFSSCYPSFIVNNCTLGPWSAWSPCTTLCGYGTHSSNRSILSYGSTENCTDLNLQLECPGLPPCLCNESKRPSPEFQCNGTTWIATNLQDLTFSMIEVSEPTVIFGTVNLARSTLIVKSTLVIDGSIVVGNGSVLFLSNSSTKITGNLTAEGAVTYDSRDGPSDLTVDGCLTLTNEFILIPPNTTQSIDNQNISLMKFQCRTGGLDRLRIRDMNPNDCGESTNVLPQYLDNELVITFSIHPTPCPQGGLTREQTLALAISIPSLLVIICVIALVLMFKIPFIKAKIFPHRDRSRHYLFHDSG